MRINFTERKQSLISDDNIFKLALPSWTFWIADI